MSRKTFTLKARIDQALENAVVNRQIVHDCGRAEAGRQLLRLGAGLKADAPVIRPAWADNSLVAIDQLQKASSENLKSIKGLKEAAPGLGGDLERRGKIGDLVDKSYEIQQKLESLHDTLLGLDKADVDAIRECKPAMEASSR